MNDPNIILYCIYVGKFDEGHPIGSRTLNSFDILSIVPKIIKAKCIKYLICIFLQYLYD